jgi:hypothetical protein
MTVLACPPEHSSKTFRGQVGEEWLRLIAGFADPPDRLQTAMVRTAGLEPARP